ncbi:GSCOCG00004752001-RA-CDS [Cotesia congregata]|nr:GSCOCG00004752001-RA-CDS [Cotesia congregata]
MSSMSICLALSTFSKVDFPAPEGPIMAVNSPDLKQPLTPFRIGFLGLRKPVRTW